MDRIDIGILYSIITLIHGSKGTAFSKHIRIQFQQYIII